MLLEMQNIAKDFGEGSILSDITFELDRGHSLAVIAPSGAGKSTLLSIAGLLLEPSAGSVRIDGEELALLSDNERSQLRAQQIGFLFQHTQLVGSLRAVENVTIPASFAPTQKRGRPSKAALIARSEQLLDSLGLEDRKYYYPYQLSVGQKRRVATARALLLDPPLLIADEPTNDLDVNNARMVLDALFARVQSGEAGLLFATHDRALASRASVILEL